MKRYKLQIIDKQTLEVVDNQEFNTSSITILRPIHKVYIGVGLVALLIFAIVFSIKEYTKHQEELKHLRAQIDVESLNYERCSMHAHLNSMIGEAMKSSEDEYGDLKEVYNYIKSVDVWYPEIVMAQFILESGSGTSNVCQQANNYFGMKPARTRDRVNLEGKNYNGYASYKNWKLSVLDRRLWELQWFDEEKPSLQQYKRSLTRYAEDPQYVAKLSKIIKEHEVFK